MFLTKRWVTCCRTLLAGHRHQSDTSFFSFTFSHMFPISSLSLLSCAHTLRACSLGPPRSKASSSVLPWSHMASLATTHTHLILTALKSPFHLSSSCHHPSFPIISLLLLVAPRSLSVWVHLRNGLLCPT